MGWSNRHTDRMIIYSGMLCPHIDKASANCTCPQVVNVRRFLKAGITYFNK